MAVQLPSDIVADVMRNADPVRRLVASSRLQSLGTSSHANSATFSESLRAQPVGVSYAETVPALSKGGATSPSDEAKVFRDFERVVLHSLFETMLPKADSGAFGSGPSAGVWRSMAAEQLAGVYADAGGVGIESMFTTATGKAEMRLEAQWPYFALGAINDFRGRS